MKRSRPRRQRKSILAAAKRRCRKALSEWVHIRDKGLPCISCGRQGTMQAGHAYAAGQYKALEFDERVVNLQCSSCNGGFGGKARGNYLDYREGLIKKYGMEEVIHMDSLKYKEIHWTVADLDELTAHYKIKVFNSGPQ